MSWADSVKKESCKEEAQESRLKIRKQVKFCVLETQASLLAADRRGNAPTESHLQYTGQKTLFRCCAVLPTLFLPKHFRIGLGDFSNNFQISPALLTVLQSLIVILALLCLTGQV